MTFLYLFKPWVYKMFNVNNGLRSYIYREKWYYTIVFINWPNIIQKVSIYFYFNKIFLKKNPIRLQLIASGNIVLVREKINNYRYF